MGSSAINSLSSNYVQSVLSSVLQNAGLTAGRNNNSPSSLTAPLSLQGSDTSQLSPFAQLMSTLQQLQQSDPSKYQQVTQQVATNLTAAAQTATQAGNTAAATQLNQLANDFTNASTSGQLPNISDLAKALGGHHHHHHAHAASADADGGSSTASSSSSTNSTLDPMSIIYNTLSQAGVSISS